MFGREPPAQTNYTTLITVCNPVHYLLFTYIVTSKPKRISVAAGLVHMSISPKILYTPLCTCTNSDLFSTHLI